MTEISLPLKLPSLDVLSITTQVLIDKQIRDGTMNADNVHCWDKAVVDYFHLVTQKD
jgi:hypothetical protein